MVSLAEFERAGGMGHCRKWRTSVVVEPDGSQGGSTPLGRWLLQWEPSTEDHSAKDDDEGGDSASESQSALSEEDAAAGELLMSLSNGPADSGGTGSDPHATAQPAHQVQMLRRAEACHSVAVRPQPAVPTSDQAQALYATLAAEACDRMQEPLLAFDALKPATVAHQAMSERDVLLDTLHCVLKLLRA